MADNSVQFSVKELPTDKTLAIEFGVSEQKRRIIEQESKGIITIDTGIYSKLEVENAKILFQADEIPVEFDNPKHVEKAYQNIMDNLIAKVPEYTSEDSETKLENFVLLSIPFVQNEEEYSKIIQMHLSILKNFGFMYITFLNQIAASFYSQKDHIQQEDLKESAKGLLINIGKTSQK